MNKRTFFLVLPILSIILFVYRAWFSGGEIIGGDWPYFWRESFLSISLWPSLWASWQGNGLGGVNPLLGLQLFQSLLIVPFVNWLRLPWEAVYKFGWFGLFLSLSFFSPIVLWRSVFPRVSSRWPGLLACLIYSTNTYILMVTGGGQMGVALAYGLAPLVLASFINLYESVYTSLSVVIPAKVGIQSASPIRLGMTRRTIVAGLSLGIQLMIDPRITYVTMIGVGIYVIFSWLYRFMVDKKNIIQLSNFTVIHISSAVIIAVFLNAFWVLPMVVMRSNPLENLGSAYTSIDSIKFFSFADFSHTLSLLHPNWPENMFGKTYFLQPEFLVLPALAFASLLFMGERPVNSKQQVSELYVRFFAFLALFGAFLAKGADEPFGNVYLWLFDHVPGFVMFRDPSKWYVWVALGYSILVPLSLFYISEKLETMRGLVFRIKEKTKGHTLNTKYLILISFLIFWLFTIREATLGKLGGTFTKRNVPKEYVELKKFIVDQSDFFRTLWVPRQTRFAFGSGFHPAVEAEPLFDATDSAQLLVSLNSPFWQKLIEELGIKYIIVPSDPLGEIFVSDRKYDAGKRGDYKNVLDSVPWLRKVTGGAIAIYKTPGQHDRFWLDEGEILSWRTTNNGYALKIQTSRSTKLYFSENYNEEWRIKINDEKIVAQKSITGLNYFEIPSGRYDVTVYFEPQRYTDWGIMVSLTTLSLLIACMIKLRI